jgi:hypothetical protein
VEDPLAGGVDADGLITSGEPGSPPPAAKAGIMAGLATSAPKKSVRVANLIAGLIMQAS